MAFIRIEQKPGESSASYFQRFADANGISPILLLNSVARQSTRLCESNSHLVIVKDYVTGFFNRGSYIQQDSDKMAFEPLIKKFMDYAGSPTRAKFLAGMIDFKLKFCPQCVEQYKYYKLLWQVREITVCDEHGLKLVNKCPMCNQPIPLLTKDAPVGFCPYCGTRIGRKAVQIKGNEEELVTNYRAYEDWNDMFALERVHPIIPGTTINQAISAGLLYLITKGDYCNKSLSGSEKKILDYFRECKNKNKTVHLEKVLGVIRNSKISFHDFINCRIPQNFLETLRKPIVDRTEYLGPRIKLVDNIKEKIRQRVEEHLCEQTKISINGICDEFGIHRIRLKELGLHQYVKDAIIKQQVQKRADTEKQLKKGFDLCFKNNMEKEIKWSDVQAFLQFNPTQIRNTFPKLKRYISEKMKLHNNELRAQKVSSYICIAKRVLEKNSYRGINTGIHEIAEEIGLTPGSLRVSYPELMDFIRQYKNK